jgi:SPP1 gp7 family putative phage head morphogenesis protein
VGMREMKPLPGQQLDHTDYAHLLKDVDALLWELVYLPIVDLVRPMLPKPIRQELAPRTLLSATHAELMNALDNEGVEALKKALRDGIVQMIPDHTGKQALFAVAQKDRRISDGLKSFGCKLNNSNDYWSCSPSQVPMWVRAEAQGYAAKAQTTHELVKRTLDEIEGRVDAAIDEANLAKAADHAITEVAAGWKDNAKKLEASWDLGAAGQQALVAGFERSRGILIKSPGSKVGMRDVLDASTKTEIKVWAKEALARLRAEVDENASQGYRAEGLADRIRNEYGVSKGRANLIARQETNNFMANYRAARAADAGLEEYKWMTTGKVNVRKDHAALHGKIFRYDKPPITDTRTGARNNPGQDFRCACTDCPVLRAGRA